MSRCRCMKMPGSKTRKLLHTYIRNAKLLKNRVKRCRHEKQIFKRIGSSLPGKNVLHSIPEASRESSMSSRRSSSDSSTCSTSDTTYEHFKGHLNTPISLARASSKTPK